MRYKLQWEDRAGVHDAWSNDLNGITTIAIALRETASAGNVEIWDMRPDSPERIYG